MPTITIPDRETLSLGRNGAIGNLDVDWSKVPQHVLDHIWKVYKVQYFTDAANAGGKDATQADRFALAQKKLDQAYAGELRARGEAQEPVDPIEAEAWRMARDAMTKAYKEIGVWDKGEGKGGKRFASVVHLRREERGLPKLDDDAAVEDAIEKYLAAQPHIREAAARIVEERQVSAAKVNLDDLGI